MKIIKISYENRSNKKKWRTFKFKTSNMKIKPYQISSNKRQGFVRNQAWIKGLFASIIVIKSTRICRKRISVRNQTLILKHLKICYWCMKTLYYCLMMSCDYEDWKKWNKTGQKLVGKVMFLGRTWKALT